MLIEALQHVQILGTGLDTQANEPPDPNNPLFRLPNVRLTLPHARPTVDNYHKQFQNRYATIERMVRHQPPL